MTVAADQPALFGLRNYAATGTGAVTASTAAASYPVTNLQIPSHSTKWRSTGVASASTLDVDLGAVRSDVEGIILHGTNLTDSATIRVQLDSDSGLPSPEHDSGTVAAYDLTLAPAPGLTDTPPWGRPVVYIPAAPWTGRYLRITLTDTGNAAGYLSASYLSIGPALQLGIAPSWSPRITWLGPPGSSVARTEYTVGVRAAPESTRRHLLSVARALRGTGRFTLISHPGSPDTWPHETVLARLTSPPEELALPERKWDLTLTVEEVVD